MGLLVLIIKDVVSGKKLIDEVGNKYGKLTVIERVGTKVFPSGQKKPIWLCSCECGNTTEVYGQTLRRGDVKSCGCLRLELDIDWSGVRQGKLTVTERAPDKITKSGAKTIRWMCQCDCGGSKILKSTALRDGASSCGCEYKREKHGHTVNQEHSPTFTSWHAMMQRCHNENHHAYALYGAVGITVCERWKDFTNFLADVGERPDGTSLNRIHGATVYSPETAEWATLSIQAYDQKKRNTNTSGKTGVSLNKNTGRWEAYITVQRKTVKLGLHDNFEDAVAAREAAELKYYGWTKE